MYIEKLKVRNLKALRSLDLALRPDVNIIVGDNAEGKSTILEAVNAALTGQWNGRPMQYELHPLLFSRSASDSYVDDLQAGESPEPPTLSIELFLADVDDLAILKGTNNSEKTDCPGLCITVSFDKKYAPEYAAYIKDPERIKTIPTEFYSVRWSSFSDRDLTARSVPIKCTSIDGTSMRGLGIADRFFSNLANGILSPAQRAELSLTYRQMKYEFSEDPHVKDINAELTKKRGEISDKHISVSLDTTTRSTWESGISLHLDDIPLSLEGKGEQNMVKVNLAMDDGFDAHVFLIEEPENHLSHSNMNRLIGRLASKGEGKQLILTTHSSFVLNKLGLEGLILLSGGNYASLEKLNPDTYDYFMKLPGFDTLRLILSKKAILVEGPSDELVVQRAYKDKFGKMPLEDGVDVITVRGLSFKRFLEIAKLLNLEIRVVTDNDGDVAALDKKYEEYSGLPNIAICFDKDETAKTLEPQILKANNRAILSKILGKAFGSDEELLKHMANNKSECAMKIFTSETKITVPEYIKLAVA